MSGPDRPGITADLMGVLHRMEAGIQDVEQVLVRRHLTLAVIVDTPDERRLLAELLLFGWDHHLAVEVEAVDPAPTTYGPGHVVTVLAPLVNARALGAAAAAVTSSGGNITRIVRLARYPVTAYELQVNAADGELLRTGLAAVAAHEGVDVAVQDEGLGRRAKRLVMLDVDSTLIQNEMIDLLADEAGVGERVAAITERAMAGDLDFEAALRSRVALLEGLDASAIDRVWARIELTPGARTFVNTLKRLGLRLAAVSGGFTCFTDRLAAELGLDHAYANELEISDGRLTGKVVGGVVDRARKGQILSEVAALEGVPLTQTVAVGDGANDLDMLRVAGLGIAFCAKAVVREAADTSLNVPYLDAILFVLGVTREEVEHEELTRSDPPPVPPDAHRTR